MEQFKFLDKKDQIFPSTNAGKRTIEWAKENNFKIKNREDIWRAYIARLESIFADSKESKNLGETKSHRALRFLKYKILKNNTLDLEDEDGVKKIARGLYDSEKKIAIERGMGGDIEKIDDNEAIDRYIENVKEKKEIQSTTLTSWINYITGRDCTLPTWFKYHVIRSLLAMGTKNVEKSDYNKRAGTTVSPYPEFNSEALGWVYGALTKELKVEDITNQIVKNKIEAGEDLTEEDKNKEASRVEEVMSSDRFSKLFYFASIEAKGNLDRSFVEGEWIKYSQGSDHTILEKSLKGKGTGWCTAEGSAAAQLEEGDFYVYYSKNGKTGQYTEPRVAVRMSGDGQISEVRGVNPGQELEPQFADIVDDKMNDFGESEAKVYKKKSSDMKRLTTICKKNDMGEDLNKEDLRFVFEIDSNIEGFGYGVDPRIKEVREKRVEHKLQDYIKMFDIVGVKEVEELKKKLNIEGLNLQNPDQIVQVGTINPKQILAAKNPTETRVGIYCSDSFESGLSPILTEHSISERVSFSSFILDKNLTGKDILDKTESKLWTMDQISQLVDNQSNVTPGVSNAASPLLTDGNHTIFLTKDKDGNIVTVRVDFGSGYCSLDTYDFSLEWPAGVQVLVRN